MTASTSLGVGSRSEQQRLLSRLHLDSIPEMVAPPGLTTRRSQFGGRAVQVRTDAPYFNASLYCKEVSLRFSMWMRHPAIVEVMRSLSNYYREAARERMPHLVMQVKSGPPRVHGYYAHLMLEDALSAWCACQSLPPSERPRIPTRLSEATHHHHSLSRPTTATFVYTAQTVIAPGSTPEVIAAAEANSHSRIANIIGLIRQQQHPPLLSRSEEGVR